MQKSPKDYFDCLKENTKPLSCLIKYILMMTITFLPTLEPAQSQPTLPLDSKLSELKRYGSLKDLCLAEENIEECKLGIGEWKPQELEKVRSLAPQCFDECPLDTYGFVRSPDGSRDYPQIKTKDFDPLSPSKGVEFILYPVAISILKYEGCAGCSLIKYTPTKVILELNGQTINLPMLGYGIFYIPRKARALAQTASREGLQLRANLAFSDHEENRAISAKAVTEYIKMLEVLNYTITK